MFELTDAPFGVNLPIMFFKDDAMLAYICDSGVKFVTTSAGSPSKFIGPLKEAGIVVYHAVPTVEAAIRCVEAGIDGLVVEGGEGGGFKNRKKFQPRSLTGRARRGRCTACRRRGICDGRGMAAAFALGAKPCKWARGLYHRRRARSRQLQIRHCRCADNGNLRAEQKASPCIRA